MQVCDFHDAYIHEYCHRSTSRATHSMLMLVCSLKLVHCNTRLSTWLRNIIIVETDFTLYILKAGGGQSKLTCIIFQYGDCGAGCGEVWHCPSSSWHDHFKSFMSFVECVIQNGNIHAHRLTRSDGYLLVDIPVVLVKSCTICIR